MDNIEKMIHYLMSSKLTENTYIIVSMNKRVVIFLSFFFGV